MANLFGIREDGTYRVEMIGASRVELTDGYVVATRPIAREADVPTLGELFGRWTDPDTGTVYWDAVEVLPTLTEAVDAARVRGELAIWDAAESMSVFVGPHDIWVDTETAR